jgi:flagellar P-ring protein FlgI
MPSIPSTLMIPVRLYAARRPRSGGFWDRLFSTIIMLLQHCADFLQFSPANVKSPVRHCDPWRPGPGWVRVRLCLFLAMLLVVQTSDAFAAIRLKELAVFKGTQDRDLVGYGLVVGLDGTGDGNRSAFTTRSIENMLKRFGIKMDPGQIKPKNVASVMVTAKMSAFSSIGDRLDVTVSSLGDASSLMGGLLIMTPLTDREGEDVIARAQGPISIGGFNFAAGGSSIRKNYTLVGRIPEGAVVEVERQIGLMSDGALELSLRDADFTNARRVEKAINEAFGEDLALAASPSLVRVQVPEATRQNNRLVEMASIIEHIEIEPDMKARVVINERTGTVVVGKNVQLSAVVVAHGNLSVIIKSQKSASGNAFTGDISANEQSDIEVTADEARLIVLDEMIDASSVARALNSLGVSPRDIISIFQLLKEAGALQAELVII